MLLIKPILITNNHVKFYSEKRRTKNEIDYKMTMFPRAPTGEFHTFKLLLILPFRLTRAVILDLTQQFVSCVDFRRGFKLDVLHFIHRKIAGEHLRS